MIVKGIEGIPQGNLDQYIFRPDDPAYEQMPECVKAKNRRFAISCYSWPGIHPVECMRVYGRQLRPLMRTLIERAGRKISTRMGASSTAPWAAPSLTLGERLIIKMGYDGCKSGVR